jgi:hypothetical protein
MLIASSESFHICASPYRRTFLPEMICRQGRLKSLTLAKLKAEDNSSGWFRCVSPAVGVEGPDSEVGIFIDITPVLSAQ